MTGALDWNIATNANINAKNNIVIVFYYLLYIFGIKKLLIKICLNISEFDASLSVIIFVFNQIWNVLLPVLFNICI